MNNNRKIWTKIVQLCCMSIILLSLFLLAACGSSKKDSEKKDPQQQEQQEQPKEEQQPDEQKEPEVPETLPADLEELHYIDFGFNQEEYTKGTHKGEYGGTTLDNTVISGKVTFTPKGDTHILFGGTKPMGGFGLSALVPNKSTEWVLRLYDTNVDKKGVKFDPIFFYSDVAGTQLVGKEIDLKVSIQYVDNDGDGNKNDVKVGMWFNDKLYDNKYIYLKDYASLSYSMGTWMTIVVFKDAQLFIN